MAKTGRPQDVRPFTDSDYQEIKQRLKKGESPQEIAESYGVLLKTFNSRILRAGIVVPERHRRRRLKEKNTIAIDKDTLKYMKELYKAGHSMQAIGKMVYMSAPTVRKHLIAAGVELRPLGEQLSISKRKEIPVYLLYYYYVERGLSQQETARLVKRPQHIVRRELKRRGWLRPFVKTIDKETLEHYYVELKWSQDDIAKELGTSRKIVSRELKRYGLFEDRRILNGGFK